MPRLKVCTALNERGQECSRPLLDDAPVSLCSLHILVAWQYAEETELYNHIRINDRPRVPKHHEKPATNVVYYVRFQDRIKIGTTVDLPRRLAALPHDELLAIEPGDHQLERRRHKQFANNRTQGEWFQSSLELLAHIENVLEQHGNPNGLWAKIAAADREFMLRRLAAQGLTPRSRVS